MRQPLTWTTRAQASDRLALHDLWLVPTWGTPLEVATIAASSAYTDYQRALQRRFAGLDHGEAGLARLRWLAAESHVVALRASERKPLERDPARWSGGYAR